MCILCNFVAFSKLLSSIILMLASLILRICLSVLNACIPDFGALKKLEIVDWVLCIV